jgi:hypothetical protein
MLVPGSILIIHVVTEMRKEFLYLYIQKIYSSNTNKYRDFRGFWLDMPHSFDAELYSWYTNDMYILTESNNS